MANALISNINTEQAARSVTGFAVFRGCNYYFFRVHRKPQCSPRLLPRKGMGGMPAPGPSEQVFAWQPLMAAPAVCSTSEPLNLASCEPLKPISPEPLPLQSGVRRWRDPHGQKPQGATRQEPAWPNTRVEKQGGGLCHQAGTP